MFLRYHLWCDSLSFRKGKGRELLMKGLRPFKLPRWKRPVCSGQEQDAPAAGALNQSAALYPLQLGAGE